MNLSRNTKKNHVSQLHVLLVFIVMIRIDRVGGGMMASWAEVRLLSALFIIKVCFPHGKYNNNVRTYMAVFSSRIKIL